MNTGFVRLAVATVPTVYGIETMSNESILNYFVELQQYLPFTVLKQYGRIYSFKNFSI